MLSKKNKLLLFFIALLFAGSAYCQIPEVMVGDTSNITIFYQPPSKNDHGDCEFSTFDLATHSNNNFQYKISYPQYYRKDPYYAAVLFIPNSVGNQVDSTSFWSHGACGRPNNFWGFEELISKTFTAKGIDSIVVIKIKNTSIILPIDTQASKYESKIDPFYFYSNIADSVLFDSWQLVIDPSAKISFTVDSNSNTLTEYTSKPFTRKKQLNFTFSTTLPATDTAQSFPATMKTRVRYKGVDSIYKNNFTIILPAAPKSEVKNVASNDLSFTINPNPISKQTTFIVATANTEPVTLELFDLLGNRKAIIANGEHINGVRNFHFDSSGFATGSYFVRLVCRGQVITRKIIIE